MDSIQIQSISFNQDHSDYFQLIIIYQEGFIIYDSDNLQQKLKRNLKGGLSFVEMTHDPKLYILVGGGIQPKFPQNKIILWDDCTSKNQKLIGEISFMGDIVRNIKSNATHVVAATEKKVYVYELNGLKFVYEIPTTSNLKGILAINIKQDQAQLVVAAPAVAGVSENDIGRVIIWILTRNPIILEAHKGTLRYIEMNASGSLVATASDKGTVIRIFNTFSGKQLQELRRGTEFALISCIAFDHSSKFLACTSDQGKVHIFSINSNENTNENLNIKSKMSIFGGIFGVLNSEWSFAQYSNAGNRSKIAFSKNQENGINIIQTNGVYIKAKFDCQKKGECIELEKGSLLQ